MAKIVGNNVRILQEIQAHSSDVTCVEFWGNNLLFTGSSDKTVRVWRWNVGTGFEEEVFSPLRGHRYGVTSVRVSPQGGVLASSSVDGTLILWDLADGTKTHVISQENGESIRACIFSPDGEIIATSDDSGAVCIWDQSKSMIKIIKRHEEAVYCLAFAPDSSILLTACSIGNIRISYIENDSDRNIEADCMIDAAHDMGVLSADFCNLYHSDPSDYNTTIYTLATCGTDHIIKLWRLYCLRDLKSPKGRSRLVPSSPQEHMSGSSTIFGTETMNAKCVLSIPAHGSSVTCVRFNKAGTLLVSSSMDKTIKLWDLQGNCLKTLAEHTRYVNDLAINSDSSVLASGSNDRRVIIWDLTDELTIESHLAGVRSLLFSLASRTSEIPVEFICPITHEIMKNPAIAEDGFTYEQSAIEEWFTRGNITSPMTNLQISSEVMENSVLRDRIEELLREMQFESFVIGDGDA